MTFFKEDPSDEQLFADFLRGEDDAFSELVFRYEKKLFGYLCRYTANAALAEDIFQETFIKVFDNRDQFDTDRRFQPWLFQIATNTARDYFRTKKSSELDLQWADTLPDTQAPDPANELDRMELGSMISKALEQLPENQREIFLLREFEGFSYQDAAQSLNRPLNTVKSDMRRALLGMRKLLDHLAPDFSNET